MISNEFLNNKTNKKDEEITDMVDLIRLLESWSEDIPYLDPDYNILVLAECKVPFIVMSPQHYIELEKRIIGIG
jgi:hypothetical protein